ncbi:unnamed protein product [Discula destructiva]
MKRKTPLDSAADDGAAGDFKEKRVRLEPSYKEILIENGQIPLDEDASVTSKDTGTSSEVLKNAETPPTLMTEASDAPVQPKRLSDMKRIPCTIPGCSKMFNRQARLDAHLRAHNDERPFACHYENCDKTYTDNKFLRAHIDSAHLKLPKFVCDVCGQGFATGQRLQRHGDVHIGAEKFRCREYPPCNETFRKRKTLERHVLKDHLGKKPFVCNEGGCGDSYATLNALKAHTQREHGDEKFVCGPCSDKVRADPSLEDKVKCGFTTKVQLEMHIRHEHVNCVHCGDGVAFSGQYELERHIDLYHTGSTVKDRKTVVCEYEGCEKRFVKRSNMMTHFRTAHEGLRFTCGKVDTSETPGLEGWDWKAAGCGQRFTSKVGATEHALYVHLGLQRPVYEQQQQPFKPKKAYSFLDEVSGVTDLERRPIKCSVSDCAARFMRYADMHNHVATCHASAAGSSEVPQTQYGAGLDGQQGQPFAYQGHALSEHGPLIYEPAQAPDQRSHGQVLAQPNQIPNQVLTKEDMALMQLVDVNDAIDPQLLGN